MARAELQKRGLVEADVRARLLEDGINIDTLSPADYPAYQDRIMRILDQMEAEKAQPATGTVAPPETPYDVAPKDATEIVQTTMGEAAAEAALWPPGPAAGWRSSSNCQECTAPTMGVNDRP